MPDSSTEVMLAQEQAVIRRAPGVRKGVEAAFGLGGETEGTLVLTDRRLVYVAGKKEEGIRVGAMSAKRLYFEDVESLNSMKLDSASLNIPLGKITRAKGHRAEAVAPKLEVAWGDAGGAKTVEFVQQITGRSRRKNLDDWAKVIQGLASNNLKVKPLPPAPSEDELEGKVLAVLGDMQQKGILTVESEVEDEYKLDLDPDEVEDACAKLVASGLVKKFSPRDEDPSYVKVSPLGDDDLSA